MIYRTVFDVTRTHFGGYQFLAVGIALCVAGLAAVILRHRFPMWIWPKRLHHLASPFAFGFLFLAIAFTLVSFSIIAAQGMNLRKAYAAGHAATVEGRVSGFVPAPYQGHADERFCVGSKCFEYSDYVITGGFNTTSSHGGPIKDGMPVRVTYVGDLIVKLEVAQ